MITTRLAVTCVAVVACIFIVSVNIVQAVPNNLVVTYLPVSPLYAQQRQTWMKNRLLEDMAEGLGKIKWPRQLTIKAVECGKINAFYSSQEHSITICYEFVDDLVQLFSQTQLPQDQQGVLVVGALMFVLLHETGHAAIGEFNIPAVGREEDAADQFAALAFVADPDGQRLISGPLWWFSLHAQRRSSQNTSWLGYDMTDKRYLYADEHGVDEQRYYNLMCLLYGTNPSVHQAMVEGGMLTPERAQRCPSEYQQIRRSWDLLLKQNAAQ